MDKNCKLLIVGSLYWMPKIHKGNIFFDYPNLYDDSKELYLYVDNINSVSFGYRFYHHTKEYYILSKSTLERLLYEKTITKFS